MLTSLAVKIGYNNNPKISAADSTYPSHAGKWNQLIIVKDSGSILTQQVDEREYDKSWAFCQEATPITYVGISLIKANHIAGGQ